jgi:hypothetical protein
MSKELVAFDTPNAIDTTVDDIRARLDWLWELAHDQPEVAQVITDTHQAFLTVVQSRDAVVKAFNALMGVAREMQFQRDAVLDQMHGALHSERKFTVAQIVSCMAIELDMSTEEAGQLLEVLQGDLRLASRTAQHHFTDAINMVMDDVRIQLDSYSQIDFNEDGGDDV